MVTLLLNCIMKRTPRSTLASSPTLLSSIMRLFIITHLNCRAQLLKTSVPAEHETISASFTNYKVWDLPNYLQHFHHLKFPTILKNDQHKM